MNWFKVYPFNRDEKQTVQVKPLPPETGDAHGCASVERGQDVQKTLDCAGAVRFMKP